MDSRREREKEECVNILVKKSKFRINDLHFALNLYYVLFMFSGNFLSTVYIYIYDSALQHFSVIKNQNVKNLTFLHSCAHH